MTQARRLLVTVLGTNPREAAYELDGRAVEARLATIALLELAGEEFDEVLALCTTDAKREALPLLRRASATLVRTLDIPLVESSPDVRAFLERLAPELRGEPTPCELTLDLTHGPRHLSMLTLFGALYASALGRANVSAAHYALLRDPPASSPFIDLRPLLDLASFTHAARVLRQRGDPGPLADEVARRATLPPQGRKKLLQELRAIAFASSSALPLELGRHARVFLDDSVSQLRKALDASGLPLVDVFLGEVSEPLERLRLQTRGGQGWKKAIQLTREELDRQARLIDDLLERGAIGPAVVLMEEWLISWACLRMGANATWLNHDQRSKASEKLHALRTIAEGRAADVVTEDQRFLARFWRRLTEARNAFAHAGMRAEDVNPERGTLCGTLADVLEWWNAIKGMPEWPLEPTSPASRALLVSPLGMSAGPLFSALKACPLVDHVLVVCSDSTRNLAREALEAAGVDAKVDALVLKDFLGGVSEIHCLADVATCHLAAAEQVFVNLTGGTTVMGLAVEQIALKAERLGRPVLRFGLIDSRPRHEQEQHPYVAANPYWLDEAPVKVSLP